MIIPWWENQQGELPWCPRRPRPSIISEQMMMEINGFFRITPNYQPAFCKISCQLIKLHPQNQSFVSNRFGASECSISVEFRHALHLVLVWLPPFFGCIIPVFWSDRPIFSGESRSSFHSRSRGKPHRFTTCVAPKNFLSIRSQIPVASPRSNQGTPHSTGKSAATAKRCSWLPINSLPASTLITSTDG